VSIERADTKSHYQDSGSQERCSWEVRLNIGKPVDLPLPRLAELLEYGAKGPRVFCCPSASDIIPRLGDMAAPHVGRSPSTVAAEDRPELCPRAGVRGRAWCSLKGQPRCGKLAATLHLRKLALKPSPRAS